VSDSDLIQNHASFIWSVADLLRGDYKQSEYGKVILPFVVLRRLDCVLAGTKAKVLAAAERYQGKVDNVEPLLEKAAGQQFFNRSKLQLATAIADPANLADNLHGYLRAFSQGARDVLEKFDLHAQIDRLDQADLLYLVTSKFAEIDLGPAKVSNLEMGYLYEELIRRFSELSNETAGEHFTPREVIRLMVALLFSEDDDLLSKPGVRKTIFDPACGTGGMLSVADDYVRGEDGTSKLLVHGQELNAETYAICRSDMMLKGQDATNIRLGNSFSEDRFAAKTFDYMLANPPFGVEWKKVEKAVRDEAERGYAGRFGAGLPRINDGSFLFLQHMISKMKPAAEGGSRLAIVFNGSPLFTGAAGSGESEIRRWIIENDWLEAVVALPDQLFYNTGISTYFWIVTNRKSPARRGKVQLIDARGHFAKMRKSLGEKRKQLTDDHIGEITKLYASFTESDEVKILPNESFGFLRLTVERPLRRRWEVSDVTLDLLRASKAWAKHMDPVGPDFEPVMGRRFENRQAFLEALGPLQLPAPVEKELVKFAAVPDADAPVITKRDGSPEPDPDLRDQENVPLPVGIATSFEADPGARLASSDYVELAEQHLAGEIHPYVDDAWIDHVKTRLGYEIPLTRHFYKYRPPRALGEIDAEIKALEKEIQGLLEEVTE